MGIVDGNCRVGIYIHLLDLTRNRSEKCNLRFLAEIEPAALRFRYIALTNWATQRAVVELFPSTIPIKYYSFEWDATKILVKVNHYLITKQIAKNLLRVLYNRLYKYTLYPKSPPIEITLLLLNVRCYTSGNLK